MPLKKNLFFLDITIDNCNKCGLETIHDENKSQYFSINRRDLEIETKRNWQVIFVSVATHRVKNIEKN